MDHRKRIEAKKVIIKQSQDPTSEIPLLPYAHLEIINFKTYLDEALIELLDEDKLEGGLTGELFFDCIKANIDYLAFEPFRQKIKGWQEALSSEVASEGEKKEAKDNLGRIGKVLTWEGQGRPKKHNETFISLKYKDYESRLDPILKRCREQDLSQHRRKKLLIEEWPELANYPGVFKHRTAKAMTKALFKEMYGIKEQNLITLLKKA